MTDETPSKPVKSRNRTTKNMPDCGQSNISNMVRINAFAKGNPRLNQNPNSLKRIVQQEEPIPEPP